MNINCLIANDYKKGFDSPRYLSFAMRGKLSVVYNDKNMILLIKTVLYFVYNNYNNKALPKWSGFVIITNF